MQETIDFAGSRAHILIDGAATDGMFSLLLNIHPPGNATPPHRHETDAELVFMLSGSLQLETDGHTRDLQPGECATLPPRRPHRIANRSAEPAISVMVCAPAGFENFVRQAGEPAQPGAVPKSATDRDRARLATLAQVYGIDLLDESSLTEAHTTASSVPAAEVLEVTGLTIEVLAQSSSGAGGVALMRATLPPEAMIPIHSHSEPECFYVLEGRLGLHLDGTWHDGGPGTVLHVPGHATHAVRNSGPAPCIVLCAIPASLLSTFRNMAQPDRAGRGGRPGALPLDPAKGEPLEPIIRR